MKTIDLDRITVRVGKTPEKTNLAPRKANCQPRTDGKVEEETEEGLHTFIDKMDAIAYGVEARYELITGHSEKITKETVAIARQLGIPEDEIEKWAALRLMRDMEKVSVIKHFIENMEGSFLAILAKGRI